MPRIDYKKLASLVTKNEISGTYLLYGDEQYLLMRSYRKFIRRIVTAMPAFNLQVFECTTDFAGFDAIEAAVQNLPMMAPQKAVVLHDLDPAKLNADDTERLKAMVKDLPETTVLVLYNTGVEFAKKGESKGQNLLRFLEKNATVTEFPFQNKNDVAKYLVDEAAKLNCHLPIHVADLMIERSGLDLTVLMGELEKVAAFTGRGEIKKETVSELVIKTMDATSFDLARAVLRSNIEEALRIVGELKAQRADPIMVFGAVNSSVCDLYRAKCAIAEGKLPEDMAKDFGYSTNVRFRVDNAYRDARKVDFSALRRSVFELHELDGMLKNGHGEGYSYELLESTVVTLCTGSRAYGV